MVKYMSALGYTTLTAYFVAMTYSGVTPEDEGKTWLITGAAGATGSALIQIVADVFKPKKIIAVAGGEDKCRWVETLGKNITCLNYRSKKYKEDFYKARGKDAIDVFVDLVGGWILEHALPSMAVRGKVVQVGSIATYNDNTKLTFSTYPSVVTKRLLIQGMIISDHSHEFPKAFDDLSEWFATGKLHWDTFQETIVDARGEKLKEVPQIWTGLFSGKNKGKYVTQVGDYRKGSKL